MQRTEREPAAEARAGAKPSGGSGVDRRESWEGVGCVLARTHSLGLDAAGVEAMSDAELDACLYPKATTASLRPGPDCAAKAT
jgi:hypothetical protein